VIELPDRVALVTGAGTPTGQATALAFAQAGAQVALVDHDIHRLQQLHATIAGQQRAVLMVVANCSDATDARRAVGETVERYGRLDVVVTNAHSAAACAVIDMQISDWDEAIARQLDSVFFVVQAAAPELKLSPAGRVISICRTPAGLGQALMAHNAAAEAGVIAMLRGLAQELGPSGITTNAIVVGPIDRAASDPAEARIPAIRDGSADDVPGAVLFLASDAASWITGQCLQVNGGFIPK
jgi:NAD(P)-dependent dehydrogenase (short-subunit alcohol dehydrogenase family)